MLHMRLVGCKTYETNNPFQPRNRASSILIHKITQNQRTFTQRIVDSPRESKQLAKDYMMRNGDRPRGGGIRRRNEVPFTRRGET